MAWQVFAMMGVVIQCLEQLFNKQSMVMCPKISLERASFLRTLMSVLWFCTIGTVVGLEIRWVESDAMVVFVVGSAISSLMTSYLMRNIRVTTIGILGYLAPVFFVGIDSYLGYQLSMVSIMAILLMALATVVFMMDEPLLCEMRVLGMIGYQWIFGGIEVYYVKELHTTMGIHPISTIATMWGMATIVLLFMAMLRYSVTTSAMWKDENSETWRFVKLAAPAKLCDGILSVVWSIGITKATISQFSAIEAFYPLVLLVFTWIGSRFFSMQLQETGYEPSMLFRKVLTAGMMVTCAFYV